MLLSKIYFFLILSYFQTTKPWRSFYDLQKFLFIKFFVVNLLNLLLFHPRMTLVSGTLTFRAQTLYTYVHAYIPTYVYVWKRTATWQCWQLDSVAKWWQQPLLLNVKSIELLNLLLYSFITNTRAHSLTYYKCLYVCWTTHVYACLFV